MSIWQALQDLLEPEDSEKRELKEQRMRTAARANKSPVSMGAPMASLQEVGQTAGRHFDAQDNAIATVNDAISKEMQSRVNQNREMRRMAHAQELERIRQDGMLRRLKEETVRSLLSD